MFDYVLIKKADNRPNYGMFHVYGTSDLPTKTYLMELQNSFQRVRSNMADRSSWFKGALVICVTSVVFTAVTAIQILHRPTLPIKKSPNNIKSEVWVLMSFYFYCTHPLLFVIISVKQVRKKRNLPPNPNTKGILTDGPDYSYTDGRPTPLGQGQRRRLMKQREYAERIMQLSAELDFAQERYNRMQQEERDKRQQRLSSKLKPKEHLLLDK